MKRFTKNIPGGIRFLSATVLIYAVGFLMNPLFFVSSFTRSVQSFIGLVPLLLSVFLFIFLINVFLKPEAVKHYLGTASGLRGWLSVCLGSVVISSPPYILLPMLRELKEHGMKPSLIALFLNNRNVQIAYLPVMAHYFGWAFTVVVSVYILIFAFANALILGRVIGADSR